jgi:hypothetical protein
MRFALLVFCTMLCQSSTGCVGGFLGEWVMDGTREKDGTITPVEDGHRQLALKFEMPWAIRYGRYVEAQNVVDSESVQNDTFTVWDRGDTAQFGSMIARREGNGLILVVGSNPKEYHFRKVSGPSIFPPIFERPPIGMSQPADAVQYAAALENYSRMLDRYEAMFRS